MTSEDFFRAFGEIDGRFVEETVEDFDGGFFYGEGIGMSVWRKVCLAAACFTLIAVGAIVIYVRSRSGGVPVPPLSGNGVADSVSEVVDSSNDSAVFTEIKRTGSYPKQLDDFDYNTDFYDEPNADAKPFKGLEKDDTPICTVNNKDNNPSVFCYGGGMVYFSLNGGVYEYDTSEKTVVRLFVGTAYDLNYRDGMLYYVSDPEYKFNSRDIKSPTGRLFRYDTATKETSQLTDFDVSNLVVTDDGIYFVYTDYFSVDGNKQGYIHMFTLDEETGECVRLYSNFSYIEYGGYRLKWSVYKDASDDEPSPFVFEKDDVQYVMPEGFFPNRDCICGDDYYFIANTGHALSRMNMLTGEITAEIFDETDENGIKWLVCDDYTVLDGDICYIDRTGTLCRYNEESGESERFEFITSGNKGAETVSLRYLYTDGESIYAVTGKTSGPGGYDEPRFARIEKSGNGLELHIIDLP